MRGEGGDDERKRSNEEAAGKVGDQEGISIAIVLAMSIVISMLISISI